MWICLVADLAWRLTWAVTAHCTTISLLAVGDSLDGTKRVCACLVVIGVVMGLIWLCKIHAPGNLCLLCCAAQPQHGRGIWNEVPANEPLQRRLARYACTGTTDDLQRVMIR